MNKIYFLFMVLMTFFSCGKESQDSPQIKTVVCTTTQLTDLTSRLTAGKINVIGLMGTGVDPHLYKASAKDVTRLSNADLIIYNGLHLEGKVEEVLEKIFDKEILIAGEGLSEEGLIESENFQGNYDPHIWFDISHWKAISHQITASLSLIDPDNSVFYENKLQEYVSELSLLEKEVSQLIETLPQDKRVLITAHDAFGYFGKAYGFTVKGLQGLSTADEAGVKDVKDLAEFIVDNKVKAVFIETSIPKRNVEALQAAVKAKGFDVKIGGELYSDALGDPDSDEGTYIGMYRHNVKTIVSALK